MTTSLSNYCINSNIQYNPYPLWLAIVYLWCYHAAIHQQRHLVYDSILHLKSILLLLVSQLVLVLMLMLDAYATGFLRRQKLQLYIQ